MTKPKEINSNGALKTVLSIALPVIIICGVFASVIFFLADKPAKSEVQVMIKNSPAVIKNTIYIKQTRTDITDIKSDIREIRNLLIEGQKIK